MARLQLLHTGLLRTDPEWKAIATAANAGLAAWRSAQLAAYKARVTAYADSVYGSVTPANAVGVQASLQSLQDAAINEANQILGPLAGKTDDGAQTNPHLVAAEEIKAATIASSRSLWYASGEAAAGRSTWLQAPESCNAFLGFQWQDWCRPSASADHATAWAKWLADSQPYFDQLRGIVESLRAKPRPADDLRPTVDGARDQLTAIANATLGAYPGPARIGAIEQRNLGAAMEDITLAWTEADAAIRSQAKMAQLMQEAREQGYLVDDQGNVLPPGTQTAGSSFRFGPLLAILGGAAVIYAIRRYRRSRT